MLEKMAEFFEKRLDIYDEHMLRDIEGALEFYPFTAKHLPTEPGCRLLDLGCGTGLELEFYFPLNPTARVTGIDLSPGMLRRLKEKFPGYELTLIEGSYFDVPFGEEVYDAAVSVESLHHFAPEEKTALYAKLHAALKPGGYFILTDYFARSEEEEDRFRRELERLESAQGAPEGALYHFDTPLTVSRETDCLLKAGFSSVKVLGRWGATHTLRADKSPGRGPGVSRPSLWVKSK